MAKNIKGIIVEIGGDTSGLQKALSKVDSATVSLSKELKGVNSLLKLDPSNTELVAQKQVLLSKNIEETSDKLKLLKEVQEQADNAIANGTKISEENYRNLQREIANTENKLKGLTDELKQFNSQNSNWTKAGKKVQEYGEKVTKVGEKIDDIGNKVSILSAGVVAGGTAVANSAMNLEDAVAKYVSSTNTAEEETEKYRQVLENINKNNYGEGYEDIADSMAQVKMQLKDIDDQNLQNITEKAIALRDLFGYDVSESVRAVKAMMDNFNISADEAFNLIAEGKKQGLDFSNELLDNVNEYSVQFDKLGLSAQDMFNLFKVGADNGAFNLDKIGDAVKEFSIRAIDGSNTTIDGFKRLGLNADEMAEKFANGGEEAKEAFIEVVNRLGNMDDKVSQSIAGVDLFGTMWEDLGPTVVTSFSEMDNGISQSSDSMQESIDELYNTTKKKAEKQLKRLQSLGADFGEEMLPVLEDLIDMAEGFIDKLEGMSDAEKENIIKIGLFVAGAGPLIKTMGTAGKVIGTATSTIGNFAQAIGNVKNGVKTAEGQVGTFTTILTKLTSPTGIAVTATAIITALGGAFLYLSTKQTEAQKEAEEFAEEMSSAKQSLNEYNESVDDTLDANLNQIDNVSKLRDELKQLVDENGKVKEGYEGRVSFILNELNDALGTEYELNNNIIKSYQDLQGEIDKLIEKKQAEIILSSNEEKYKNAIENQQEAIENLKKATENLGGPIESVKSEYDDLLNEINDYFLEPKSREEMFSTDIFGMQNRLEELKNLIDAYENAEDMVKTYTENVKTYEENYALFVEGKYNEISNTVKTTTKDWCDTSLEDIKNNIQEQGKSLETYKQIYENTGNEVAAELASQAQSNLESLASELASRTQTINDLGEEEILAWQTLAQNSFDTYSYYVSQMAPEMQEKIQEATGVVIASTPEFAKQAGIMGEKVIDKFDKNSEAKEQALKTLQGYYEGLTDEEKADFLMTAVGDLAGEVAEEFESGDYDTSGRNVLEGIYNGLNNSTWGQKLVNKAANIAKSIANQFNIEWDEHSPSKLMEQKTEYLLEPIDTVFSEQKNKLVKKASNLAQNIAGAFSGSFLLNDNFKIPDTKSTGNLSNKVIDGTKNVSNNYNVEFKVQELDEARLEQCFNYMNRKFGIQY